jgi:flavin-dependent dehydrogenase
VVRRAFWADDRLPKRYTAVQASFDTWGFEPHYGAVFDAELTDYYGWTIPKGDALLVGGAFPVGHSVSARFDALIERLRAHGFRVGAERTRGSAMVLRPTRPTHVALGRGRVALIGEAAGLISPSSAEGISYALRSAASLAEAVRSGTEGAVVRYRDAVMPVAAEVVGKMLKSQAIHGTTARRTIMASGIGAIAPDAPGHIGAVLGELLMP